MTTPARTQLRVDRVHRMSARPLVLLTGRLEGEPLKVGQQVVIHVDGNGDVAATVTGFDIHEQPGLTTIVIDAAIVADITVESVVIAP